MVWVAIEAADTYEISDFKKVSEEQVPYLMAEYRVDKHDAVRFHLQDEECDVVYEGIVYKGGFGYNLWVASKASKASK